MSLYKLQLPVSSIWLVILGNLGVLLVLLSRASFDSLDTGDCIQQSSYVLIWLEVAFSSSCVIAAVGTQVALKMNERQRIRYRRATTELDAATSLLELTCDAVVELDEDLRLTDHSSELAAILLRKPDSSLAGHSFLEFVASSPEQVSVRHMLSASARGAQHVNESSANAFHTRLADSCRSKFRTEVFHVSFRREDGQQYHLLGLRDFTDQKSLAKAHPNNHGDGTTVGKRLGRYTTADVSPNCQGGTNPLDEVEKSRPISLIFDMDSQVVDAASCRACFLVGQRLDDLFPNSGHELFQTFWARMVPYFQTHEMEAVTRALQRFDKLPVQWAPSLNAHIDGTVELIQLWRGGRDEALAFCQVHLCLTRIERILQLAASFPGCWRIVIVRRKELWERRQKHLLAEVQTVARKLTQKRLMEVLAEKDEVRTTYTGLPENAEEKLRELRDKSQAEIDRAVDAERLKLIGIQKCSERHEKILKQVDKQRAEQHEKLVESMKARQAKRDKQAEAMDKNLKDMRKESGQLIRKLNQAFKKVDEHKAQTLENWQRVKEDHEEHIRSVQERREHMLISSQEEMVETYLDKEWRTRERLDEKRERELEKAEQGQADFMEKIDKSRAKLQAQQKKREEKFIEAMARHAKAREELAARYADRVEKVKESLTKHFEKRDQVLANERREKLVKRRQVLKKLKQVIGPDSPRRIQYIQEEVQRRVDQRETMGEIVQQNLLRIQRQEEWKHEELLTRIEDNNARVERIHEDRAMMLEQHTMVLKEAMIAKARIQDELRCMKVVAIEPQESEEKEKEVK
ncbi:unnamed protein product [Symbiodinium sp. CCMP2592]|nr:unnamed protein product [Symbiodinium sp. CCMP2592]